MRSLVVLLVRWKREVPLKPAVVVLSTDLVEDPALLSVLAALPEHSAPEHLHRIVLAAHRWVTR